MLNLASHILRNFIEKTRGSFLDGPKKFSHPKSRSKISDLLTRELFYTYIFNTSRGSLHTRNFRRVHLSVFKYRFTKNGFSGPENIAGFRETGPESHSRESNETYLWYQTLRVWEQSVCALIHL